MLIAAALLPLLLSAAPDATPQPPRRSADEFRLWRVDRARRLNSGDGWTTLVGLHWLKDGAFTAGSAPGNAIALPDSAPPLAGTFHVKGRTVRFVPKRGVEVSRGGAPFAAGELRTDARGPADVLHLGFIRLSVVERNGRLAVRVRDTQVSARMVIQDALACFPHNPEWRRTARWELAGAPRTLKVHNAAGYVEELPSPGTAVFSVGGKEFRLDAVQEHGSTELLFPFTDETSGDSTFAAGRYVVAPLPDGGTVVLDFNMAFSPPNAFTRFATCPLPPPHNRLALRVEAGERAPPPIP